MSIEYIEIALPSAGLAEADARGFWCDGRVASLHAERAIASSGSGWHGFNNKSYPSVDLTKGHQRAAVKALTDKAAFRRSKNTGVGRDKPSPDDITTYMFHSNVHFIADAFSYPVRKIYRIHSDLFKKYPANAIVSRTSGNMSRPQFELLLEKEGARRVTRFS